MIADAVVHHYVLLVKGWCLLKKKTGRYNDWCLSPRVNKHGNNVKWQFEILVYANYPRLYIRHKYQGITHKAIYGTAPNYLSSLVNFKPNSSYSLRSNNKYLLSNPNFRTLPTLGDWAFVAAAPKLWNNLLLDLKCTSDFRVFKRNLKTHLF